MSVFDKQMEALARSRFDDAAETFRLTDPTQPFHGAFERANRATAPGQCIQKVVSLSEGIPQVGPGTLATLQRSGILTNADVYSQWSRLAILHRIGPERASNIRTWAIQVTDSHDRLSVDLWHLRQKLIQEKRQRQQLIGCLLIAAAGLVLLFIAL